jgi:hypothetical protein
MSRTSPARLGRLQRGEINEVIYMCGPVRVVNPAYAATEAEVKAITDLEEEARRAGALPGWLR